MCARVCALVCARVCFARPDDDDENNTFIVIVHDTRSCWRERESATTRRCVRVCACGRAESGRWWSRWRGALAVVVG